MQVIARRLSPTTVAFEVAAKVAGSLVVRSFSTVGPNPSLKLSTNGGPRGPGLRYGVHSRSPGPRVPPSVPA